MAAKNREDFNSEIVMKKTLTYSDANEFGYVAAGDVARIAELTAVLLSKSFCNRRVVTACIDQMLFKRPLRVGDKLVIRANINYVQKSSMEIGVRIEVENKKTAKSEHVTTAYMVLVAMDENMKPVQLPPIEPASSEQKRRFEAGRKRMEQRAAVRSKSVKDNG
ncbi:MAG: hypothetical protein KBA61_02735 [Spirochaetes bacterium]|nr:hypothetical protein [Spirochaetota bacterium]